ncbi:MAG: PQQ-binding-like beta-propeller repeat protein [Fuerstiella sp.]
MYLVSRDASAAGPRGDGSMDFSVTRGSPTSKRNRSGIAFACARSSIEGRWCSEMTADHRHGRLSRTAAGVTSGVHVCSSGRCPQALRKFVNLTNNGKAQSMNVPRFVICRIFLFGLFLATTVRFADAGEDWPLWRYDASRSAASPNRLPSSFQPLWRHDFSARTQAWDDPLNLDLMPYDRIFEPIVMDGRLYVGFNDQDKLLAIDADTGRKLWTFFADAPIRLPPAGWQGRVFVCSDDGCLYCLDAATGQTEWKFSGAPNSQHVIGNRRLTSAWPARGAPVVRDDTVYFAASVWPFMGTFIYALDAESGRIRWVNDSTGSQYIKQPHSAPSFAGVAPQGALVATDDLLIVPGGRSVPAVFSRADGQLRYFEINAGGKGTGGSFVAADQHHFYVHTREKGTRAFQLESGSKTAFMPNEPVLSTELIYYAETKDGRHYVRACDAGTTDGRDRPSLWSVEADGSGDLIQAGDHLVAAGKDSLTIIKLAEPASRRTEAGQVVAQVPVDLVVARLLVADQKLFAVTDAGSIMAFGEASPATAQPTPEHASPTLVTSNDDAETSVTGTATASAARMVSQLLEAGDPAGYAFWFGECPADVASGFVERLPFVQLAIVDQNSDRVAALRRQLDKTGHYGRITAHVSAPAEFRPPQFVGNMVFVAEELSTRATAGNLSAMYAAVRPYGGVMYLLARNNLSALADRVRSLNLEQAQVEIGTHGVIVRRVGALPGSADWTHQYGDIANTIKSNDQRVKLPLGVLWFGGSSNMDVLPRHGHGPPEQVVGGRLFIEGINMLSARDVYTGRILWKREFEDLGTYDVYFDATYENTPLNPKYNQVHIPGANGRGTNYVVTEDRIYLVAGNVCHLLDPATGQDVGEIRLPADESGNTPEWGYLGVYEDVLIGGLGFANYRERHQLEFESDKELKSSKAGFGSKSLDRAASRALVGFDRHSGQKLWQVDARHSFWHNGIVAGGNRIYCLDRNPELVEAAMRRRGRPKPETYRILAFDPQSGQPHWEVTEGIFGTWLGYSEQHDVLLQAGARASDRLTAEVGQGMRVYHAKDGSLRWKHDSLKYSGPCILHNDLIITNANSYADSAGAFDILTGDQKMIRNPVTGALQPWKISRAYGCNSIIASENLLTFRSGAAGYYDLLTDSGTGNLGGFKSGCTSNLVVANGVLNAPDYTRTCSCAYQNQTSLALVHMPEVEMWSVSALTEASGQPAVESIGINFGAPGDRRDAEGTLWVEYPTVSGDAPPLELQVNKDSRPFQRHSSAITAGDLPWVLASGLENVTELSLRLTDDASANKDSGRNPSAEQYDVQMYFALPTGVQQTDARIFDVYVQGQRAEESVTLSTTTADGRSTETSVVRRSWTGVAVDEQLKIELRPAQGQPVLSGLRIRRSASATLP